MTKSQAHKEILAKYEFGLITLEEAQEFHRQINRVSVSNNRQQQKEVLYKVWA